MKEKIEKVWAEHKVAISAGLVIGGAVILTIAMKKYKVQVKDDILNTMHLKGKSWISWDPTKKAKFLTIEEVKKILDANEQTEAAFAIFREGLDNMDYVCIGLDEKLVWPFS